MSTDDLYVVYNRMEYYSYWPMTAISIIIVIGGLLYVFCLHRENTKAGFVKVIWALIVVTTIVETIRMVVYAIEIEDEGNTNNAID